MHIAMKLLAEIFGAQIPLHGAKPELFESRIFSNIQRDAVMKHLHQQERRCAIENSEIDIVATEKIHERLSETREPLKRLALALKEDGDVDIAQRFQPSSRKRSVEKEKVHRHFFAHRLDPLSLLEDILKRKLGRTGFFEIAKTHMRIVAKPAELFKESLRCDRRKADGEGGAGGLLALHFHARAVLVENSF